MRLRAVGSILAIALVGCGVANAQEQGPDAIRKLAFLAGSWQCAIQGAHVPAGDLDHLSYEFSPDWSWMVERSHVRENGREYWSLQMWGYDAGNKKLVAYQFSSTGVSTKSVDGWVGGKFQSRRDDNGATVTIVPIGKNAFNWVIESADHSNVVTEACSR